MVSPDELHSDLETKFPLIDNDPHFFRAIRYMRPWPDYAWIAGGTLVTPLLYTLIDKSAPLPHRPWRFTFYPGFAARILRFNMFVGCIGGFLMAYENSCLRLLGARENKREYDMDMIEMKAKIAQNKPLYGESELTEDQQAKAARNSRFSALFMFAFPWFNVVNHPYHGVDKSRYLTEASDEHTASQRESAI